MPADDLAPGDTRPAAMISTTQIWYVMPVFTESYRKVSNISRTKSQNLIASRLLL